MLSQEERELLIKTYEKTHDAKLTAEIFGVNERTVYERIHDYKERGTTELRTHQRGRKSLITPEDEERIKELIQKNNDITSVDVPRVSPAGSVGASAFGRGVHRTPAPSKGGGCHTSVGGGLKSPTDARRS